MRISPIVNYKPRNNKTNQNANFAGAGIGTRIGAEKATKVSLLAVALLSIFAGCASAPSRLSAGVKHAITPYVELNPAQQRARRARVAIQWFMSADYISKKPKFDIFASKEYLLLNPNNPITEGYNYKEIEDLLAMPKGSLTKENGLYLDTVDSAKGKNVGMYSWKDGNVGGKDPFGRIKVYVKSLPAEVQLFFMERKLKGI